MNAQTLQVQDHNGDNALSVSPKGYVKMNGGDCRLDVDGDIWNSGHDMHTSALNCGILNANLAQPYTCNVTGDLTSATLTVAGHVVSGSLNIGSINVGEWIAQHNTAMADLQSRVDALEAIDLSAINTLIQSIQQSDN